MQRIFWEWNSCFYISFFIKLSLDSINIYCFHVCRNFISKVGDYDEHHWWKLSMTGISAFVIFTIIKKCLEFILFRIFPYPGFRYFYSA